MVIVRVASAVGAETLKGFEQAVDLLGHDHRAGVSHRQERATGFGSRDDLDSPIGNVVVHGVVEQVSDEAFDEAWVAFGGSGFGARLQLQSEARGLGLKCQQDGVGDG